MSARVLVECKGPPEQIRSALSRVSGVSRVDILNGEAGGADKAYVRAAVKPKEQYDIREEVARAVISHGWPLREIKLEHATLEEFFVQVTASQAVAKPSSQGGAA